MSKPIFFKPEFYSGEPDECVNEFIENYNLISVANEWSDDKKIIKLKLTETVSQFLADFQLLAHKVNPKMMDKEKIDLILEALPPDLYNPVALMNNNTLSDLQKNLRKVEPARATVNERNNTHNFDALKAEIESLNQKLHYKPNNNMNNHNQSNHLTENTNQGSYSGQNNDLSNKKTFNNQKNM
ncbi:unnamed protein product [Macrosiphum euphorbiae]|uniref:Uncharacterized protein n=1 Tax=Macrosiphum euphorbiae TaxID=13131 RepID=A0AAV0VR02_9HEMI|nr:unnamed protein product [Macrosiphum euphorbiae]